MKMWLIHILISIFVVYIAICVLLYLFQEKLIFFPENLSREYQYRFDQDFEELDIEMDDGVILNGILFRADTASAKGLIFYLHGNAGSLRSWGEIAIIYTGLNYDLFMPDYRGYGKSEGTISSEKQIYRDMQTVYNVMKDRYAEDKIIILGYSIGTGPATKLASENHPRLLILQAPFYSMKDMKKHYFPIVPNFILKYKFDNSDHVRKCSMPIVLFHGDRDEIIYYGSSLKLKELLKRTDKLVTLNGQSHNGMSVNPQYIQALESILNDLN